MLNLVEQLSKALNDEFRIYLPDLLPRCVTVLTEAERTSDYKKVPPVLHTFEVLGGGSSLQIFCLNMCVICASVLQVPLCFVCS